MANFSDLNNSVRNQKINIQGLPSSAKRNSGSNLIFLPKVKLRIVAGLPKVKLGMVEIPLLVTSTEPLKYLKAFVLSGSWAKEEHEMPSKTIIRNILCSISVIVTILRMC